jgi:hypothetical protein
MFGRIALEHEARRPPWRFALKVAEAHAAARAERGRIAEDFPHLGVAGGGVSFVSLEPHDRPRLAQGFVGGMGIAKEVD